VVRIRYKIKILENVKTMQYGGRGFLDR